MESKEPILLGSLTLFHSLIQMEGKEPSRHIKPLEWEQSKLHSIKAVLDATQNARMSKRQHRTSAKITRVQEICLADPYPKAALLGRLTQSQCCHVIDKGWTIRNVFFCKGDSPKIIFLKKVHAQQRTLRKSSKKYL